MEKLGEILVKTGLVTKEDLNDALEEQQKNKDFIGTILLKKGLLSEKKLISILSDQTGYPIAESTDLPDKKLNRTVSWVRARKFRMAPLRKTGSRMDIAFIDPSASIEVEGWLQSQNIRLKPFIIGPNQIENIWTHLYGNENDRDGELLRKGVDRMSNDIDEKAKGTMSLLKKDYSKITGGEAESEEDDKAANDLEIKDFDEIVTGVLDDVEVVKQEGGKSQYMVNMEADTAPIIKMVSGILIKSAEMGASDIHIEPFEKMLRVRFRVDGTLHEVMTLPSSIKNAITARIKIMAEMDIAEHRIPQDGRIKIKLGRKEIDLRVNTLPSMFGEKTVIRLLGQSNLAADVSGLGFSEDALVDINRAVASPYGMILVTGPTGSGKSTTLYTILNQLNQPDINITTAEDPVEYNLTGITQVQVHQGIGFTFDVALRAFLRQDPDVIMVGEIRDNETVGIAVKAALTGHLVLSTLHTNDSVATVTRLFDMDVDTYLVAAAVKVIIAQRLVRTLCPNCKKPFDMDENMIKELKFLGFDDAYISELNPQGPGECPKCNNIGYKGRKPVFEVLSMDNKAVRDAISEGKSNTEITKAALDAGMETLKACAFRYVKEGHTSVEEALKISVVD